VAFYATVVLWENGAKRNAQYKRRIKRQLELIVERSRYAAETPEL